MPYPLTPGDPALRDGFTDGWAVMDDYSDTRLGTLTGRILMRRDRAWAVAYRAVDPRVLLFTLRWGVGGPEDSPKFQFVGRVLGTACASRNGRADSTATN